jgi:cell division septation protein DedD
LEKTVMYKLVLTLSLAALLSVSGCSRQQSDWEKTRASNTTDAYESFLKKYPSGEFTAQAQARLKELYEERDWQKARDIDSADAYQAFLKQYPEGKWSEEARIRIENFTLAAAPTNGTTASPAAAPPSDAAPPAATGAAPPPPESSPKPAHKAAQTPPAKAPGAAVAGAFVVQLGAFKTGEEAANKRWANLSGKYPKLLSGLSPLVSSRKVATGTMYRLQVVNLSGKRARAICKDLKAHSQACEVLRPAH